MKPSVLDVYTKLNAKLLEFPALVDSLQRKDLDFLTKLMQWIQDVETICKESNLSETAELAGFRSKIVAQDLANTRRLAKKEKTKVASEIMYDLQHLVLSVSRPYERKIHECRDIVRQLLGIIQQSGAITYDSKIGFQVLVDSIWSMLSNQSQLKPGAAKLKSLIPEQDILRIIAEEIDLADWTSVSEAAPATMSEPVPQEPQEKPKIRRKKRAMPSAS
jgi:hypothetical protein